MNPEDFSPEEDVFGELAALAAEDVDTWRRDQTRRQAHRILARHRRRREQGRFALRRLYESLLEPALAGTTCLAVLAWTAHRLTLLLGWMS